MVVASGCTPASATMARHLAAMVVLSLALVFFGSTAPASLAEHEPVEIAAVTAVTAVTAVACLVAIRRARVSNPDSRRSSRPERDGWDQAVGARVSQSNTFDGSGRGPPALVG
jgi:hypothetical protein